jgi:hypothetical protein
MAASRWGNGIFNHLYARGCREGVQVTGLVVRVRVEQRIQEIGKVLWQGGYVGLEIGLQDGPTTPGRSEFVLCPEFSDSGV